MILGAGDAASHIYMQLQLCCVAKSSIALYSYCSLTHMLDRSVPWDVTLLGKINKHKMNCRCICEERPI